MPLPPEVLTRVAALEEARDRVRRAVEGVLTAQQPGADPMTKTDALELLEDATDTWLTDSHEVEDVLFGSARTDEPVPDGDVSVAADAVERLFGISQIHLAVSSDLAKLSPIDFLADDDPVTAADSPPASTRPSVIEAVAESGPQNGQVGRALTVSAQQADEEDDEGPDAPPADPPAGEVLTELVDRANECSCKVLLGAVPAADLILDNVRPLLESALGLAPDSISAAAWDVVRSVGRLVRRVLRRVREVIDAVAGGTLSVVEDFLKEAVGEGSQQILGTVVRPIVAKILQETHYHAVINQKYLRRLARHEPQPHNTAALRRILKHNNRWVARPVPILTKGLRPLWHVMIGPVPAAPVAACLLLAWTLLLTGDELDVGPLNFYRPGLLTIA